MQGLALVAPRGCPEILGVVKAAMKDTNFNVCQAAVEAVPSLCMPGDEQMIDFLNSDREDQPFEVQMAIDDALEALAEAQQDTEYIFTSVVSESLEETEPCMLTANASSDLSAPLAASGLIANPSSPEDSQCIRACENTDELSSTPSEYKAADGLGSLESRAVACKDFALPDYAVASTTPSEGAAETSHGPSCKNAETPEHSTLLCNMSEQSSHVLADTLEEASAARRKAALSQLQVDESDSEEDEQAWFRQSRVQTRSPTKDSEMVRPCSAKYATMPADDEDNIRPKSAPAFRTIHLGPLGSEARTSINFNQAMQASEQKPAMDCSASLQNGSDAEGSDDWEMI
jgi:hypothetical protein